MQFCYASFCIDKLNYSSPFSQLVQMWFLSSCLRYTCQIQSNSHASKEKEKNREEKKVEKIISGNAKAKKKSEFSKFADFTVAWDTPVKFHNRSFVIIPIHKYLLSDKAQKKKGKCLVCYKQLKKIIAKKRAMEQEEPIVVDGTATEVETESEDILVDAILLCFFLYW